MLKSALLISVVSLLTVGCATTSPVVPIGNGNYEITGSSATAIASGASQKVRLLQVANRFCDASGKQMVLVNAEETNGRVGYDAWADANGHAAAADASADEGPFGNSAHASAAEADSSYHSGFIHPGQRANADVVFRCE